MEEKKLTDEEIVKAYEYCRTVIACDNCPYDAWGCGIGVKDITDIINRQKAEIKRLTERLAYFQKSSDYHEGNQKELEAQNAELQKQVNELTEERENMQAEILRFEDMKFTQEHCNLYEENEWLKANLQQAVKDTAKEILDELLDIEVKDEDYKMFFLDVCEKLEKFAQKYGVEVE